MKKALRTGLVLLTLGWVAPMGARSQEPSAAPATPSAEPAYLFLLAQTLAQDGEYREALSLFEQVVESLPDEPYVRIEYAELLFRLGRMRRAEQEAARARELAPDDPETLRLHGQINLRLAEEDPSALDRARGAFERLREVSDETEARVTLGQIYLSQERVAEAADIFAELLEQQPSDRMFVSFLLESLQRLGRAGEAEEALVRFLEIDPEFLRARLGLAGIRSERGDHRGAVEILKGGVELGEEDPELLRQLAVELYRSGNSEDALARVDALLERQPDHFGSRYLKALALVDLGRLEQAEQELGALLEESPENLDLAHLLARVMEHEGRPEEAAEVLAGLADRLLVAEREEAAAEARLRQAELLSRLGEWDRVLELTSELRQAGGGRVGGLLLEAEALSRLDRPEAALDVLRSLSEGEEAPPPPRIVAKQAEILFGIDRGEEARLTLEPLTRSDDVDTLILAADVLQRHELYGEAVPILDQALAYEPNSLQLLFRLGASLEREGRRREAETRFRRLLTLDPDFAPALNYLGYMWAEHGENLSEALDLVQRAVALEPNNGAYIDSLGWAYYQLGQFLEARNNLERAAELVPDDAVIHEHLGDVYVAVGDLLSAQEVYQRALTLSSENEEQIRRKLREIEIDR